MAQRSTLHRAAEAGKGSRPFRTNMKNVFLCLLGLLLTVAGHEATASNSLDAALKEIRAVDSEGKGNLQATKAWKTVAAADAAAIPLILEAMDGANELALNWLRSAVDSIAERELVAGHKLPLAGLENFLRDTRHSPRARRLSYELIAVADPDTARKLIAAMANDPSTELRRDAVQRMADEAAKLRTARRTNDAISALQSALRAARDVDQIESFAKQLKEMGHPVELPRLFGWLNEWKVIGPFDNTGRAGFEQVFPPEQHIDFRAEYDGKQGKVRWQSFQASGDYGLVDLNKPCGMLKEVTGYACAEVYSDKGRVVELRLGCKNAWKVWLNGRFLFGRDEYHRGVEINQYRLNTELKPGSNVILVKVCQNEQQEDWTKEWEFQLRITDALGTPIAFARP
jgi:hypothetical protein